jgi:hypothetical protein
MTSRERARPTSPSARRRLPAFFLVAVAVFGSAGPASALESGKRGDIAFIAGGVGLEERSFMQSREASYSAKLVFAATGGGYIAQPHVDIHRDDRLVFSQTVDGPWLLVNLPPGRYVVTANARGELKRRDIVVTGREQANYLFTWETGEGGGVR